MKVLERYYKKIYKHTNRLLKKVFGLDVIDALAENYSLKNEIESQIEKPIDEITSEDLVKNKLTILYCKYRTLDKILSIISGVAFLNSFCNEDLEEVKK